MDDEGLGLDWPVDQYRNVQILIFSFSQNAAWVSNGYEWSRRLVSGLDAVRAEANLFGSHPGSLTASRSVYSTRNTLWALVGAPVAKSMPTSENKA